MPLPLLVRKQSRMKIFKTSCRMNTTFSSKPNVGVIAICRRNGTSSYRSVLWEKAAKENERKITELEAEQQNLQTAPNAYPFLDVYRKYRKLEEITRPMVVELIEKIEVYEGNRVEITFRFHDEIADLLEELHQKQMGQREVSA